MDEPRKLVLLRHGQAGSAPSDFNRPLTDYGRNTLRLQGSVMARTIGKIDLALVSSSTRTRESVDALHFGGLDIKAIEYEETLYTSNYASHVLDLIHEVDPAVRTLLVVMHEPAVSELAYLLSQGRERSQILHGGFSTATFAWGTVDGSWGDLETWNLGALIPPGM